jgi:hypothetical protein
MPVEDVYLGKFVPSILLNDLRALKTNAVDFSAALAKICPVYMPPFYHSDP